jgi:hypothetical protein
MIKDIIMREKNNPAIQAAAFIFASHTHSKFRGGRNMFSITLHNPFGTQIDLEVRGGSQAACDSNGVIFHNALGPNASYPFDTSESVVCWRRTSDPDTPGSPLGQWVSFAPNDINTPVEIQL